MKPFTARADDRRPTTTAGREEEPTLADALLGPDLTDEHDSAEPGATTAPDDTMEPDPDEDAYADLAQRRPSRLTRVLLAVLLLLVGVLAGVQLDRALAPEPPARVVYLLGDPGPSATASTSARPGG